MTVQGLHWPGSVEIQLVCHLTWARPHGCRLEANATKDLVDALTCVSYLVLRERKTDLVRIATWVV